MTGCHGCGKRFESVEEQVRGLYCSRYEFCPSCARKCAVELLQQAQEVEETRAALERALPQADVLQVAA